MDAYEATHIIFSRIQALDPENAAKTMGLLRRHLPFSGHDPAAASQLRARASLSPLRRDSHQIPIGSYNPVNDSLLGTSPVSSRFDAGSEFSDDVSVSRAASSMPGSSREMTAMKAGGDSKATNTVSGINVG